MEDQHPGKDKQPRTVQIDTAEKDLIADLIGYADLAASISGGTEAIITVKEKAVRYTSQTVKGNISHSLINDDLIDLAHSFRAASVLDSPEKLEQYDIIPDDIEFFACFPLNDHNGLNKGMLILVDVQKHTLHETQLHSLDILCSHVVRKIIATSDGNNIEETINMEAGNRDEHTKMFRNIIQQFPASIIIFRGPDLIIDTVNQSMLDLLDQKPEIMGRPLVEAIPALRDQGAYNLLSEIYHTGKTVYGNETPVQLLRNGIIETGYFNFVYTPLIEDGKIVGIIDMAVEVTDQVRSKLALAESENLLKSKNIDLNSAIHQLKKSNADLSIAEESLKNSNIELLQSRQRLQTILDIVGEGIGITDDKGNIVYTNKKNREIFKYDEKSLLSLKNTSEEWHNRRLDGSPLPPEEHPISLAIATGKPVNNFEFLVDDKNNDPIYLRMNTTPIRDSFGRITGAVGSFSDITESFLIQKDLMEREENLRMAITSAELGTWKMDVNMRKLQSSNKFKQLFGFSGSDDVSYHGALKQISESYRQKVEDEVENSIANKKSFEMDFPVVGRNDGRLRWLHGTGKLYINSSDEDMVHFSGTVADITERKLDEQRRSDFIGMVSHELKNPLTALKGYSYLLKKNAAKTNDEALEKSVSKIENQLKRMESLINGFLEFARLGEGKIRLNKTHFDMAALVKIAEEESLATITSHPVIFAPVEFTPVEADQDKIEQVIINFINNAVKYSAGGTPIHVACITKDEIAYISVSDRGMGIPVKDKQYIFERFYRVESEEMKNKKGFGIGLYICKEIIEQHRGNIGVESTEGEGSTFWFTLPICKDRHEMDTV